MKRKAALSGAAAAGSRKRSTTQKPAVNPKPAAKLKPAAKPKPIAKPSTSAPSSHSHVAVKAESRTLTIDDYVVSYTNSLARSEPIGASSGFQSARSLTTKPVVKNEVITIEDTDKEAAAGSKSEKKPEIANGIRLDPTQDYISKLDIDKPLLIVAGAGSGKTTTLCARVIEIIKRGVMPASILVITFTNKAAGELKERIKKYMDISQQDYQGQMPFASTFHSWCYGLIMRNHRQVNMVQCPMIAATESEHTAILKIALERIEDCRMLVQCETMLGITEDSGPLFTPGDEGENPVFVNNADKRWAAVAELAKERLGITVEQIIAQNASHASHASAKPATKTKKKFQAQAQAAADEMSITRSLYYYLFGSLGKKSELASVSALEALNYKGNFGGKDDVVSIMAFIYRAKSRGDQPEDYPLFEGTVLKAYNATLQCYNLIDFDDMLKIANDLLDVPEVLKTVRTEFPYLLVDEFQDLNQLQMSLVLKMQQGIGRVTAVGDERQSIYAFRGATCEHNFQTFLDWFVDAKVHRAQDDDDAIGAGTMASLTQNYRSHQSIVDLGNIVARDTIGDSSLLGRLRVPLMALPSAPVVPVAVWHSESHHDEATDITNKIKELIDSGDCKAADIAVISRCLNFGAYHPTGLIEVGLMAKKIPYVVRGGHSALKSKRMQLFMALIRVVTNTDDDIATQICLGDVVKSIGPANLQKLQAVRSSSNSGTNLISLFTKMEIAAERGNVLPKPATESLAAFVDSIRGWQAQLGVSTLRKLVEIMYREFVSESDEDQKAAPIWGKAAATKGTDGLWTMVEAILEGFLESPDALPPQHDGDSSFAPENMADPRGPCTKMLLQAFSGQLCLLSTSSEGMGVVKGESGEKPKDKNDVVVITTVHQAKGLEWKHVFIPHFIENLFPMKFREQNVADKVVIREKLATEELPVVQHYREEGRLAYVAITRAKCGLYISVLAKYPMTWMEKFLGEIKPSRYLPAIMCPPGKVKVRRGYYDREYDDDDYY
ncbi:hypothetical protein GGI19_002298 [Coemansia pectinata]|uniref:DNA 3'-5' helicase n=1 Tax=Coemansia pectinata TaxID=1052879 RepID=A0A9W8LCD1_9FUNG|nr:hypothetical protein GGI19_002298 [Coemansia pectinata]